MFSEVPKSNNVPDVVRLFLGAIDVICSFGFYHCYLRRLEDVWFDKEISDEEWRELVGLLQKEWSDSNFLASILLSVNMGFLVLNGVTMPGQIVSIVSTFFAVASMTAGSLNAANLRVAEVNFRYDPSYGTRCFQGLANHLSLMALVLALPGIFQSWSVVTFAAAISHFAFSQNHTPLFVVSVIALTALSSFIFPLYVAWIVFRPARSVQPPVAQQQQKSGGNILARSAIRKSESQRAVSNSPTVLHQ